MLTFCIEVNFTQKQYPVFENLLQGDLKFLHMHFLSPPDASEESWGWGLS